MTAREVLALHCELARHAQRRTGRARSARRSSWWAWRSARTIGSGRSRRGCSSGSGWASRCWAGRSWWSSTSRPPPSTRSAGRTSGRSSARSRDRGATVFLNSHLLTEVERVCDRVAIVDRGRVVAQHRDGRTAARERRRGSGPTGLGDRPAVEAATFGRARLDGEWLDVDGDRRRGRPRAGGGAGCGRRRHPRGRAGAPDARGAVPLPAGRGAPSDRRGPATAVTKGVER